MVIIISLNFKYIERKMDMLNINNFQSYFRITKIIIKLLLNLTESDL